MKKILIFIIVAGVLGFLGYTFLGGTPKVENGLVSNKGTSIKVGADLLAALATLDTLKIDTEFFKDQTFRRLVNFSREIPVQPKGRSNPFAPIGGAAAATTTNTR